MEIAVFGTKTVGRAIAVGLAKAGHAVTVGTRNPEVTLARSEPDDDGNPPYAVWAQEHPTIDLGTFAEAATGASVIVNAVEGFSCVAALASAGASNLAGKVILDVSNPMDFSQGFPPRLFVVNSSSLGEQIQRAFPDARVVKTLNANAGVLMGDPTLLAGDMTVFMAGDDDDAKHTVGQLLASLGHDDVLDIGDLEGARAMEMVVPLWVRLYGAVGKPIFGIKIVR